MLLFCDNAATVSAMTSSRATDPLIRASLRECWWLTAINDVHLVVRHRPGAEMHILDLLSRVGTSESFNKMFAEFKSSTSEIVAVITSNMLMPPIHI